MESGNFPSTGGQIDAGINVWWIRPKLPVTRAQKDWLECSMLWLHSKLRKTSFCDSETILPIDEFFPIKYAGDKASATALLQKVGAMMDIPDDSVRLEVYSEPSKRLFENLTLDSYETVSGVGHFHPQKRAGQYVIGIEEHQLVDPFSLVATIAHELGHVLLLGGNLLESTDQDHELTTDLLTVYFGLGIFTANSAFQFRQYEIGGRIGWTSKRTGYLDEAMYGYALAIYARMRGESKPTWACYLDTNVRAFFQMSHKYLAKTNDCRVNTIC